MDSDTPSWSDYFPPATTSSGPKNPKRKPSTDAATKALSKQLPEALTQALETAVKNMKCSVEEKPARLERPPKKVLFLPCPKMQAFFEEKRTKAQKSKHNYQGKGKKPME